MDRARVFYKITGANSSLETERTSGQNLDDSRSLPSSSKEPAQNPKTYVSMLFPAHKDSKLLLDSKSQLNKTLVVPYDETGRFIKHTNSTLKPTQAKIGMVLL